MARKQQKKEIKNNNRTEKDKERIKNRKKERSKRTERLYSYEFSCVLHPDMRKCKSRRKLVLVVGFSRKAEDTLSSRASYFLSFSKTQWCRADFGTCLARLTRMHIHTCIGHSDMIQVVPRIIRALNCSCIAVERICCCINTHTHTHKHITCITSYIIRLSA